MMTSAICFDCAGDWWRFNAKRAGLRRMIAHLFNYSDQAVGITMAALTCVMSPVRPVVNQTQPPKLFKPKVSNITWSLHRNGFLKIQKCFVLFLSSKRLHNSVSVSTATLPEIYQHYASGARSLASVFMIHNNKKLATYTNMKLNWWVCSQPL